MFNQTKYSNVMSQSNTNSKVKEVSPLKLVDTLRAMYQRSRVGTSWEEEKRVWGIIEITCKKYSINEDVIKLDNEAYNEMSAQFIAAYYFKQL